MRNLLKTFLCYAISVVLLIQMSIPVHAASEIDVPSYVLIEASTGQIICENNPSERTSDFTIWMVI